MQYDLKKHGIQRNYLDKLYEDSAVVPGPPTRQTRLIEQPASVFKYLLRRVIREASEDAGVGGAALAVGSGETSSLLSDELANGLSSVRVNLGNVSVNARQPLWFHTAEAVPQNARTLSISCWEIFGAGLATTAAARARAMI